MSKLNCKNLNCVNNTAHNDGNSPYLEWDCSLENPDIIITGITLEGNNIYKCNDERYTKKL